MKSEKGITLIALIVMIIVMLILSSIIIISGTDSIKYAEYNKAKNEIQQIKDNVDVWYSKKDTNAEILNYGLTLDDETCDQTKLEEIKEELNLSDLTGYKFFSSDYLKDYLDIKTDNSFLININKRDVILFEGIKYKNKMYYSLADFGKENVTNSKKIKNILFDLAKKDSEKEIIIKNLVFKDNENEEIDINKFIVEYSQSGKNKWNSARNTLKEYLEDETKKYKFTVEEPGYYDIRIASTDKKIISSIKTVRILAYAYHAEALDFSSKNSYIDTGVKLFSEENRNKDFIIRFTVDEVGNNVENDTIINSMREDNTKLWPGLVFRIDKSGNFQLKFNASSSTKPIVTYTPQEVLNKEVEISKNGDTIYIKVGDSVKIPVVDLHSVDPNTFYNELADLTVAIGASYKDGTYKRFFAGKLSNVEIALFEHIEKIRRKVEIYSLAEQLVLNKSADKVLVFDGTNGLPEIRVDSAENINKDFELRIKIDSFGAGYATQDTILSTKNEVSGSQAVAPGMALRRSDASKVELKGSATGFNKVNSDVLGNTLVIKRTAGAYTYKLGTQVETSYSVQTRVHDTPLAIGCIVYTNGNIDRLVDCVISEFSFSYFEEVDIE